MVLASLTVSTLESNRMRRAERSSSARRVEARMQIVTVLCVGCKRKNGKFLCSQATKVMDVEIHTPNRVHSPRHSGH